MSPQFDLVEFLVIILVLVFSIGIHEFAHAWSALKLGDRTAYYLGRVTLNPAAHLDPAGTIMMVVSALTGYGIGWGKPVPVNPTNLKYGPRVGMAITAAAGPISNIIQAIVYGLAARLLYKPEMEWLARGYMPRDLPLGALVLWIGFWINISLALFNLIPLFPLDGFSVARGIFATIRARWAYDVSDFLDRIQPYAPMVLLMIIVFEQFSTGPGILGTILIEPSRALMRLILGV